MTMSDAKRAELIDAHLDIANSIAISVWKKAPNHNEKDELISLARLGLMQSIDRWDEYCARKGYNNQQYEYFTPYAVYRMRGMILDELRKSDWATRSARDKIKKLVAEGMGLGASEEQLAESTGISLKEVRELKAVANLRPSSLDSDESEWNGDLAYDDDSDELRMMLAAFVSAVAELGEEGQTLLAMRIFEGKDSKVIAAELGLTNQYVSRLLNSVIVGIHDSLHDLAVNQIVQDAHEPQVHLIQAGIGITACCLKPVLKLPEIDRITTKPASVTCDKY